MGIPTGSSNLNLNLVEPAKWIVTKSSKHAGFYQLMAGEGNNPNCMNLKLHLNGGYQYFVISEPIRKKVAFMPYSFKMSNTFFVL